MEPGLGSLVETVSMLARGVFDEIDVQIDPEVLLVVFSPGDAEARPVIVRAGSGRDDGGALLAALEMRLAGEHPPEMTAALEGDLEACRGPLLQALAESDGAWGGISFASPGRMLGARLVHVVLQATRAAHDSYHALRRSRSPQGLVLARSLLDATISQVLAAGASAVAECAAGATASPVMRSPDEIVRAAGRVLMRTPALVAGNVAGADGFFQSCHRIATMHYEGRAGNGQMLVAAPDHPNLFPEVTLRRRIDLNDHRAVRKVLELTGNGLAVLSDSAQVHGLGRTIGPYERASESLFEVWFRSHASWELAHAGSVLMRVTDGYPRLPQGELDEDEFRHLLSDVFGDQRPVRFDRLWDIAMQAAEQRRGTTVVVTGEAAAEATRLGGQALGLEPVAFTPGRVAMLTAIDGALLIDLDGRCHAVGVILDGRASRRGDPARGARFNSAVRYVDASDHPCVAIVISEGGGVDLIRPLR